MVGVCFSARQVTQFSQRAVVLVADHDMVDQLDLQQLTGTKEIAGHLDVGVRGHGFTTWMIMLCEASSYVQRTVGGTDITRAFREEGMTWIRMSCPRRAIPVRWFAP